MYADNNCSFNRVKNALNIRTVTVRHNVPAYVLGEGRWLVERMCGLSAVNGWFCKYSVLLSWE